MSNKTWTIAEVTRLQNNWYDMTDDQLLKLFPDRTWNAIYNKALTLGLRERYKVINGTRDKQDICQTQ